MHAERSTIIDVAAWSSRPLTVIPEPDLQARQVPISRCMLCTRHSPRGLGLQCSNLGLKEVGHFW